jgi:type I restriction enzyme S subunit
VQLGEIGVVHCGQSPPTAAVNKEGRGTPYVTGPEQWDGSRLHMDKWTTEPKRMAPAGSVFVTVKGAGVGTVFPGVAAAIGRDVYAFEPKAGVSPSFVEHALRFTVQDVIRHAVGDIPGLSKSHITDHWIGLPPPEEQQLIVATIESHFSRLDAATATLERVQRNLDRYRASVLKAAVEGRLVPTEAELAKKEGRSYEPASVLLKRILAERRRRWEEAEIAKLKAKGKTPTDDRWKAKYEEPAAPDTDGLPELPEGWCWTTLEAISEVKGGLAKGKHRRSDEKLTAVPYLRVANVQRGHIDLSEVKTIETTESELADLALRNGDVLFNEGGDRDKLGRGWIWRSELPVCIHQNHVFRARLIAPQVLPEFVSWHGNSNGQQYFFDEGKHTTNLASLSLSKLRSLPVPLPPNAEQVRIKAEVERLLSLASEAEAFSRTSLHRTSRFRQSILKWAFEGRLVHGSPPPSSQ